MEKLTFSVDKYRDKKKTNKFWIIACEIADLTGTPPHRWLREVRNDEQAVIRAIARFRESKPKNKPALFTWFLNDCKKA